MKISGFTFLKNADKLYYPFKESILSILDLVDEFVIMLGPCDVDDQTEAKILGIDSPKIKVYPSAWDLDSFPHGSEYAHQTDLAKNKCTGDWLIYLQGDEVIHEDDQGEIRKICSAHLNHRKVEGFVFDFLHFFGDYDHYFRDHTWYKKEIRFIRNLPDIHSWRDAQSFRWIPDFKDTDYFRIKDTRPLHCILIKARIFHYGWVRPPQLMASKNNAAATYYKSSVHFSYSDQFDYGRIDRCNVFTGEHPLIMSDQIKKLDWKALLRSSGPLAINRPLMKHETWKYRAIHFIEEKLFGGSVFGGFKNYTLISPTL
ncbi:MAG: hypothetical protein ABIR66_08555 [Saprospiraceae bacterium]